MADGQITLDQLVSSASQSVLRALEEHQTQGRTLPHPRIWVGIWIDPVHGGFETVPGQVTGKVG